MNNEDRLKALEMFQEDDENLHPLTCGKNSNHTKLKGRIVNEVVELYCPDCDYTQSYYPECLIHFYYHTKLTKLQVVNERLKKTLKDIVSNSPWMPTAINIVYEVCPHCEKFIEWSESALTESEAT